MNFLSEIIHIPFFSSEECQQCVEYLEDKEKYLKTISVDYENKFKESSICTNLYDEYNFFLDNPQYIGRLEKVISKFLKVKYPLFVQSWGNIYRENEGIKWHKHNIDDFLWYNGYTANIFLGGDENIGLTYATHHENEPRYVYNHIKNKLGYLILMPNYIYHMVKKNDSKTIRYTIGMTISEHSDPINDHFDPEKVLCLHKQNEKTYRYA